MAFDIALFGSLSFTDAAVESWLSTPATGQALWAESAPRSMRSPEVVLLGVESCTSLPHEFVDVLIDGTELKVSCFVSQENYVEVRDSLAMLFSSAASHGAYGTLTLLGYEGVVLGEQLVVGYGACRLQRLRLAQIQSVTSSPEYMALDRRIHERFDSLVGRLDVKRSEIEDEVNPFTGRRVAVIGR